MNKLLLILALTNLIACAPKVNEKVVNFPLSIGNEQFTPYVNYFINQAKARNIDVDMTNISINFISAEALTEKRSENTLGVCIKSLSSVTEIQDEIKNEYKRTIYYKKEIFIREDFFQAADEVQRKELIMHELGHCALGLSHNDETGDVGIYKDIPVSIMSWFMLSASDNKTTYNSVKYYWNYYMDQLFLGRDVALDKNNMRKTTKVASFSSMEPIYSYTTDDGRQVDVLEKEVQD